MAAALLLTAVADSAPVSRHTHSRMASCRDERLPAFEIQFQVQIASRRLACRSGRLLGQRSSAQVGVQHDPRGVDAQAAVSAGSPAEACATTRRATASASIWPSALSPCRVGRAVRPVRPAPHRTITSWACRPKLATGEQVSTSFTDGKARKGIVVHREVSPDQCQPANAGPLRAGSRRPGRDTRTAAPHTCASCRAGHGSPPPSGRVRPAVSRSVTRRRISASASACR